MKKILIGLLTLLLSLSLMNDMAFSQEGQSVMHPDQATLQRWINDYETAPKAPIDEQIQLRLTQAAAQGVGTSLSLLNYIQYTPSERNQAWCGDCWAWAATGVMEIALNVNNGIKDRLSVQFLNSCYNSGTGSSYACCGGWLSYVASFYSGKGCAIPWSNTNASFQDGGQYQQCGYSTARTCSTIATTPKYPITSISENTISTQGAAQATAIANIKNVLNQNKGVWFGFFLYDFDVFRTFWNNYGESAIWNPDTACGYTYTSNGGGHAVLIVGYNDDDADPNNHYWLVLNSWGSSALRPNGLFRMKMNINYSCYYVNGGSYYSYYFQTLAMTYNIPKAPTVTTGSATNVTGGTATLNGTVNPNGSSTTYYFQWGTTTSYGNNTSSTSAGSGSSNVSVSANITGAKPNTTYHYRLVGTNSVGPTNGSDMTFKTKSATPWLHLLLGD